MRMQYVRGGYTICASMVRSVSRANLSVQRWVCNMSKTEVHIRKHTALSFKSQSLSAKMGLQYVKDGSAGLQAECAQFKGPFSQLKDGFAICQRRKCNLPSTVRLV